MTLQRRNILPTSGKIRAVILDLDGTLIGPGERITPAVKEAVGRLSRRLPVAILDETSRAWISGLLFGYRPREIQTYIDRQQSEWTELASAAR